MKKEIRIGAYLLCAMIMFSSATFICADDLTSKTTQGEIVYWETIKDSKDSELFDSYLKKFPNGTFAPIAERYIKKFKNEAEAKEKAAEKLVNTSVKEEPLKHFTGQILEKSGSIQSGNITIIIGKKNDLKIDNSRAMTPFGMLSFEFYGAATEIKMGRFKGKIKGRLKTDHPEEPGTFFVSGVISGTLTPTGCIGEIIIFEKNWDVSFTGKFQTRRS